jgi:NAD(P)-dependent dehydrogenase (short-subunit alcohol dehydrogenase family)
VARRADPLEAVAEATRKINPNVAVAAIPTDIGDDKSVAALYEKIKGLYGHADVLINNAGIFAAEGNMKDLDSTVWLQDFVSVHPPASTGPRRVVHLTKKACSSPPTRAARSA